jgi:VIT1/CCC1 family predicted Fe2+/Mn2+ transporter
MALEDVFQRNLQHRTHRAGWLRAAVLGANDGLVSTASLMIGVAAAKSGEQAFLVTAGAAGIAAGAMSMAVGEYVSVRSQNDIEESDRLLEIEHLAIDPEGEFEELVHIYISRGLSRELAVQVVTEMHKKDALEAHLRDELGQHHNTRARPTQAALASAAAFTLGGFIPMIGMFAPTPNGRTTTIVAITLFGLIVAGIIGARIAGTGPLRPTVRILLGGSLAMAVTAGIGQLVHITIL